VFVEQIGDDPVSLDPTDEHHLRRVLRLRAGEHVSVCDGAGSWCWSVVDGDGRLRLASPVVTVAGPAPAITVAFALVKGDRPEWIVQKLTEIGVDRIVPFESARSIVRWRGAKEQHHLDRLRRVAREAAMQSRRLHLPDIAAVGVATDVLREPGMCAAEPSAHPAGPGIVALAIGPEGGFSSDELALANRKVGLPGGVLRSETAAIVAGVVLAIARVSL
jgi:16S rRNA (uracil1498-N3)-methyltransferase